MVYKKSISLFVDDFLPSNRIPVLFAGRAAGQSQQIKYTELVQEITNDNVKEITYQPNGSVIEVSGVYKNAKTEKRRKQVFSFSHLLQQK